MEAELKTLPTAIETAVTIYTTFDHFFFIQFYREWDKFKEHHTFRFLVEALFGDEPTRQFITNIPFKKVVYSSNLISKFQHFFS